MACRGCSSSDGCECSVIGSGDGVITFSGSGEALVSPYTPEFHGDVWLESLTEEADCEALNDPMVPVLQGDGSVVITPLPCVGDFTDALPVPGNAFAFTFSGTTTDADPGDGLLRLNNATYSSVTQIYVDLQEYNGTDVTAWLDSLDNGAGPIKGGIRLYQRSDQTNWADFTLTSITTGVGYRKLNVTYNDHSGSFGVDPGDIVLDFSIASANDYVVVSIDSTDSPYSATTSDNTILANTTGGSITVNLPAAASATIPISIKKTASANSLIIDPAGAETIDGSATATITVQYVSLTLVSDGTNWHNI